MTTCDMKTHVTDNYFLLSRTHTWLHTKMIVLVRESSEALHPGM
jgi:hypothetical protein